MEEKEIEKNEEIVVEKKSNTGLKVIIVILVLALLGATGYICYDKGIIKLPVKEKEVEKKEESDTKLDKELSQGEIDDIKDFAKEISNNFALYYPLEDLSKIDNQKLLLWSLNRIGFNDSIKASEIEKEVESYFGNSIKIKHEDIECPTSDEEPLYLYEDGEYVPNEKHMGHGGFSNPGAALFYVSGEKDGNLITANFKILYSNTCGDTCFLSSYYKSYEDSVKGINPVLEGDEDSEDGPGVNLTEDLYKTVEVRIPITTFKVEKTDNGYVLKSVIIHD